MTGDHDISWLGTLRVVGGSIALLAALTAALFALQRFANVETVTITYLIAVLYAAIRGGVIPAVISALAAIGAAAFFFYPPIYDLRVQNPIHLIDLVLFIVVAVVTGTLATDVRRARIREQADTLREALIGSVSHELRTPLSSVVGAASILAKSPEIAGHPQLGPLVTGLREEADRLNDHIQDWLDATRITSEGIRPHDEWIDPGDIVNAAIERKARLLAGYRLDVAVADDLPMVLLDGLLIEKSLGQLIENAIKYSPPGSSITIRAEQALGMIRISVQDQGAGISAEELEHIWKRFYRSPRLRHSTTGSGLGLWIAGSLMVACGGHVEAFSAGEGQGTTISLHLPVRLHRTEGNREPHE